MPRIRVIHWKPAEAGPLLEAFSAAGFQVDFDETADPMSIGRSIKANPPDAIAIDTSRLPGHGRQFAKWMGETKATQSIPVLFVAAPASPSKLKKAVADAIGSWVPPQRTEHKSDKTVAEKLGLKTDVVAGIVNEPSDCRALATFPNVPAAAPREIHPVTLWFLEDEEALFSGLRDMCALAPRTKLWLAWRKGRKSGFNENVIRNAALDAGLVDYKICSLDERWSAMAFAVRKSR